MFSKMSSLRVLAVCLSLCVERSREPLFPAGKHKKPKYKGGHGYGGYGMHPGYYHGKHKKPKYKGGHGYGGYGYHRKHK